MQFQADISGMTVQRPAMQEATAAGAAFLAGLAVGFFRDRREVRELIRTKTSFLPAMEEAERERRLEGWHRAVKAAQVST